MKRTQRGFAYDEFEDLYGAKCSIQKSSLATDDAIWFGIDNKNILLQLNDLKTRNFKFIYWQFTEKRIQFQYLFINQIV